MSQDFKQDAYNVPSILQYTYECGICVAKHLN